MRLSIIHVVKYSRPRFWLYLAGPFLIGLAASGSAFTAAGDARVWIFLAYFLLPANLLVYGINDIFDYESDKLNPKKQGYEDLLTPDKQSQLWKILVLLHTPFLLAVMFFDLPESALWSLAGFVFFGVFYSAPPIRAKTKPLLDSAFNVLYIFPGLFAFYLSGGLGFHPAVVLAATFWVMAMHAFSALPDILADRQAGMHTVATFLGKNLTLLFCALCYLGAGALAFANLGTLALVISIGYALLMAVAFQAKENTRLFRVYTWFPWINTLVGFGIFSLQITTSRLF